MNCKLALYVPTQSGGHDLPQKMVDEWLQATINHFIEFMGGCTITQAMGAWKDEDGTIHREPVHIVYSLGAGNSGQMKAQKYRLRMLARNMARAMGQMCVLTTCVPCGYEFVKPDCEPRRTRQPEDVTLKEIGEMADWLFT